MGYFTGKPKSTAESIAGKLTNAIKDGLIEEANKNDQVIKTDSPPFTLDLESDMKFSGASVLSLIEAINDEYHRYNINFQYQYQNIYKDRKTLFNTGEE